MRSPVIALTGGIGSGKSTVESLFAALGVPCVDTDRIAHQLTAVDGAAIAALQAEFGSQILTPEGAMDRAAMRSIVFADPMARRQLESILHPLIFCESVRQLESLTAPYVLLGVPLLFETTLFDGLFAQSLLVDCDESLQISRVMQRSGLSRSQVEAIIAAQLPRAQRQQRADAVLDNSGSLALLSLQVADKHRYYLQHFAAANLAAPSNFVDPAL